MTESQNHRWQNEVKTNRGGKSYEKLYLCESIDNVSKYNITQLGKKKKYSSESES